jgi:hypothetical protein
VPTTYDPKLVLSVDQPLMVADVVGYFADSSGVAAI